MLPIDTCIMTDAIISKSFIGNHENAVSLEYSLNSITDQTTNDFITALADLINDHAAANDSSKLYEVKRLITQNEWEQYPGLKNHDRKPEGIALMVPAGYTEMDAEYHGFWCEEQRF